ncbi:MAG: hypothetical protein ACXVQR_01370 [Solirubrobacteraceae bacterium]
MGLRLRKLSATLACAGALFGLSACHSTDPNYASTLVSGAATVSSTDQSLLAHYSGGRWMPSAYTSSSWELYQIAAVGQATLGALPGGTAAERQVAIDTVNQAIDTHQMPNGDFDNGTAASGTSGVQGSFWGAAEGQIALELKPFLDAGTLAKWTASMEHYVDYLSASGNLLWYANGNMALRHALIALETKLLSGSSTYAQYAASAIQSTLDPSRGGALPAWAPYGLKFSKVPTQVDGSDGSGWLFESANGGHPDQVPVCANGMNPCNGFDPHYTMVQLQDALTGYALSDDPQWLRLVNVETNQLMSLTDKSTWLLNASNGSRDNIPAERLYAQVLGIFDEHNIRADLSPATNWKPQAQSMSQLFSYYRTLSNPNYDVYSLSASLATPLVDALQVELRGGVAPSNGPTPATPPKAVKPTGPAVPAVPAIPTAPAVTGVGTTKTRGSGAPAAVAEVVSKTHACRKPRSSVHRHRASPHRARRKTRSKVKHARRRSRTKAPCS